MKLTGDLSDAILKNNNKIIQEKLSMFQAYCDRWIDRLNEPTIRIRDEEPLDKAKVFEKYWFLDEQLNDDFEEIFIGLDLDK